jgi:NADPH-dependent 2,4-dienoyl-CoA reductase/sulfur reductase-like enzyme
VEVNKDTNMAIFQNTKSGKRTTKKYNNLYSLIPSKPHECLVNSGLATAASNNLLDVYPDTLQHRKYKNIFGVGDVNYLPTSKTFWASFHQVNVVRHNLFQTVKGKPVNALYDGYSKTPLQMGQNTMTYVVHYYD